LANSISCNPALAGGDRMQFDQLKRREFITLLGGWRAVRCAARETPRALVQIGPRSWSAILDHLSDGLRIVLAVFESRPPGGVPSGLQRKSPAQRGALVTHSLLARRLISVATQGVGVGHAHIAASHWAGSGVPFIRLGRVFGICSSSNGIGRPTRARGEGRTTGIDRRGST